MRDAVLVTCGSPSLNFAATPGRFSAALVEFGVLSAEPAATADDLAEAAILREAAQRAFSATADGRKPDARDVATLNSYADDEPPRIVLHTSGQVTRTSPAPIRAAFAALARDAIDTIGRHGGDLRRCEAPGCGTIFIDESRGRRRRWCSMARCGNRAKAAAFRSRTA